MLSLVLFLLLASGCATLSIRDRRHAKDAECGKIEGNFLRSPRYPRKYPTSTHCVYTMPIKDNQELKLNFNHFDIEPSVDCSYDYMEVRDKEVSYGKFCGHTLRGEKMTIDGTPFVNIVFHSDKSLSKTGFEIEFEHRNKGHGKGGHQVETATDIKIKNVQKKATRPFHNTTKIPFETPKTNLIDFKTTPMPEVTLRNTRVRSTRPPTTKSVPDVTSATNPEKPFHRSAQNPLYFKTMLTKNKMKTAKPQTTEAIPDVTPTNEANPTASETSHSTEPKLTKNPHVESTTKPTTKKPSTKPSQTTSNLPEPFPGKRQMKLSWVNSNDNNEEEPNPTTNFKPDATSFVNSSASPGIETFPTEFPLSNQSLDSSNHTGNKSFPTDSTEIPAVTDEVINTDSPTMEPEPTDYYKPRPEPENQVLDKLKLMALIQRIKLATLEMEELLIGNIVKEEINESHNNIEAKRELDDFRYGIDSYLGFGRRVKRSVKRDLGKEFIEEIEKIHKKREEKRRFMKSRQKTLNRK